MGEDRKIIRKSVRNLVEFLLRRGSLDAAGASASETAMLEGARIHRKLQKKEGKGYRAEAALRLDVPVRLPADLPSLSSEEAVLRLEGRADGIYIADKEFQVKEFQEKGFQKKDLRVIDEIKTFPGSIHMIQEPVEVHLAQAKCYAYIYAKNEGLGEIGIRMTYCSQGTEEVKHFYEVLSFDDLESWFDALIRAYAPWMKLQLDFEAARGETLREMTFPFPYREGQYELAAGVYRTIVHGKKLFLQAPTGTGKTLAVLFPALKAVGAGKAERIFYLTAKGVTGRVAVETLELLCSRGLKIRSLELVSRERACACGTVDCRPSQCPRADGHFDRVNKALRELLEDARSGVPMTASRIAECAGKYCVCPYALSMDVAEFADVVICDYNYVFHPEARLARFSSPAGGNGTILLVDEAHNLLERGREMYSADLSYREVREFRRSVKTQWPRLWRRLRGLVHVLRQMGRDMAEGEQVQVLPDWNPAAETAEGRTPERQTKDSRTAENQAEESLTERNRTSEGQAETEESLTASNRKEQGTAAESLTTGSGVRRAELQRELQRTMDEIHWILEQENRDAALYAAVRAESDESAPMENLLSFFYNLSHFCQMLEGVDSHYIVYAKKERPNGGFSLHLFCADPSGNLQKCMAGMTAAVFFSATFLPVQYYKGLLGGTSEDYEMYARSSFSSEQLKVVIVRDVTSRYRDRQPENFARIAENIAQVIACRPGNYLIYFPSYQFLENVLEAFRGTCSAVPVTILVQSRQMDDGERAAFLEAFKEARGDGYLAGFCVQGGLFGEGIDLQGDRLIGSIVVGTGIPPVEPQRELLREFFSREGKDGYDYAYRFPGMNKVLQAAGRVIRTAQDRGVVVLMDDRFDRAENRRLFPLEWGSPQAAKGLEAVKMVRRFWEEMLT